MATLTVPADITTSSSVMFIGEGYDSYTIFVCLIGFGIGIC